MLPDFKSYYKATGIKLCGSGERIGQADQWNIIIQRPETDSYKNKLTFEKDTKRNLKIC